jgi:hypothetical protein
MKTVALGLGLILSALVGCGENAATTSAEAGVRESKVTSSRQISIVFGPIKRSITLEQLQKFASTGTAEGDIGNFISLAKLDKAMIRARLTDMIEKDLMEMDRALNSEIGVAILTKLGTALHPAKSKGTEVQALRAAIILSLADDNKMSILEVIEKLPVDMFVDVQSLLKLKDEISMFLG